MKATSFFGGTKPKETGTQVEQVGKTGSAEMPNPTIDPRTRVKQAKSSPATPHLKLHEDVCQANTNGKC